ncbi:MAG: hypothetical protein RIC29_15260 [Rhodospirillaceae bacterium]
MFSFWKSPSNSNVFDRDNNKKYRWELGTGVLLYFLLTITQGWSYHLWQLDESRWRAIIALSPMMGIAVCLWAGWRMYKRVDEFQRRIMNEDITIAAFGTAFITFGYGFLEQIGFPRLTMFWVWGVLGTLWIMVYWGNRLFRR